jgi:predicted  nucleic acid-binding Zn-ribbon protein
MRLLFRFVFYQLLTGMSTKLAKAKVIQDEFSPEQPGQINVAGEVFFLNLPGQDQTNTISRMYDDSIKGDIAFQALFLGGLPIEDGGKNFTQAQQTDLRRIFRAIFGPRQRILPTVAQVTAVGRKAIGKQGVIIPSKASVFQLPCSKTDRELMVKALEIRRNKLIEQIQNYDKLAIADIHARYMRDHLKKLTQLINEEIPAANKRPKNCRYTGIIDPEAAKPLELTDERMHRLLEIFAYMLAQGKDPTRALTGRLPNPSAVLTGMAIPDAPDIYEYEDQYVAENPGKTPEYTETILKIRKVLEGDAALTRVVINDEMKKTIEEAEQILFPSDPNRSRGTMAQRKNRILDALRKWDDGKKGDIAKILGLETKLAQKEIDLKKCLDEKAALQTKLDAMKDTVPKAEKEAVEAELKAKVAEIAVKTAEIEDLKKKLAAAEKEKEKLSADLAALTAAKAAKEAELTAAKDAIAAELADLRTRFGVLEGQKEEAVGKAREASERAAAAEEAAAGLRADVEARDTTIAELRADVEARDTTIAARDTTIGDLRADIVRLEEELARRPPGPAIDPGALVRAREEIDRLTARVAALEPLEAEVARITADRDRILGSYNALLAVDPDLNPDRLRRFMEQAARVPGLEGDLFDETTRADNERDAKERAQAAEEELREANRRLQAALDARTPEEEVAALRASVADAQANVLRLNDELRAEQTTSAGLRTRLASFNRLLTNINATLGRYDLPQVPEDLNEGSINAAIEALEAKLSAPPPAPPAAPDNRVSICLLNIVYHLLKRVHISKGDAAGVNYRSAFEAVEAAAASPSITDSAIRQFLVCLKAWDNALSEEEQAYYASQDYVDQLTTLNALIPQAQREAVINLGKSLFGILYPGLGMDGIDVNLVLPVIGVLAFTKKLLVQNQDIITAAGCVIPGGLGTIPAAVAGPGGPGGPGGTGGPGPRGRGDQDGKEDGDGGDGDGGDGDGGDGEDGSGEGGDDEENTTGDGDGSDSKEYGKPCADLTQIKAGNQTVNIPLVNKLRKVPFCLDVSETTVVNPVRYNGKDIQEKATRNLLQNLESKGIVPGTPEFSAEVKKVTLALKLGTTLQVDPRTGRVFIGRLQGGSTRKLRRNTNNKTYKLRK